LFYFLFSNFKIKQKFQYIKKPILDIFLIFYTFLNQKNLPVTFFHENSLNFEKMINAFFILTDIMAFR